MQVEGFVGLWWRIFQSLGLKSYTWYKKDLVSILVYLYNEKKISCPESNGIELTCEVQFFLTCFIFKLLFKSLNLCTNRKIKINFSARLLMLMPYLFIFGCTGSLLLHVGFLYLWRAGATLCCSAWASHCGGFSCCRARALGTWASVVVARRLSSCGAWALLLCGMWDLPGPGLEPVSPALAGGFLTTAPPGKP